MEKPINSIIAPAGFETSSENRPSAVVGTAFFGKVLLDANNKKRPFYLKIKIDEIKFTLSSRTST